MADHRIVALASGNYPGNIRLRVSGFYVTNNTHVQRQPVVLNIEHSSDHRTGGTVTGSGTTITFRRWNDDAGSLVVAARCSYGTKIDVRLLVQRISKASISRR
jgi:hypothetical protein